MTPIKPYANPFRKSLSFLLIAFLLLASAAFCVPATAQSVRFVQISDVHFNPSRDYAKGRMVKYSGDLFKDAVAQVNALPGIDFVVFTGDLIDHPSEKLIKDFSAVANTLSVPWYYAQGNHDVGPKSLSRTQFRNIMNRYNKYQPAKAGYFAFQARGFLFVTMDGAMDSKVTSQGYFPKKSLDYLARLLDNNPSMPAVIFQHFPLVYPIQSSSHKVTNEKEYLAVLDAHPSVKAVVTGHFHMAKLKMRNGVAHVCAPALVQYPNAFRVITLENTGEGVVMRSEFMQTRLAQVQKKSKDTSPGAAGHAGTEADRNFRITIK